MAPTIPPCFSLQGMMPPRTRRFRFEAFWLEQPGFFEMVCDRWLEAVVSPPRVFSVVHVRHQCAKFSRQARNGWGRTLVLTSGPVKGPCWIRLRFWMTLLIGRACLLTTGLGDTASRPRSWTSTRARSSSGSVEGPEQAP